MVDKEIRGLLPGLFTLVAGLWALGYGDFNIGLIAIGIGALSVIGWFTEV